MPEISTLGQALAAAVAPYEEPQNSVRSRVVATPPPGAAVGDRYIVAAAGSGAWSGHDQAIAQLDAIGWSFLAPSEGTTLWIDDEDLLATWDGAAWVQSGGGATVDEDSYTADEPVSALRVVRLASLGHVVYARPPELAARAPIGITTHAASAGASVIVATRREIRDASWAWTPGVPVLLGPNGVLVQQQPLGLNVLVVLGVAITADTIVIRIGAPIDLAPGG